MRWLGRILCVGIVVIALGWLLAFVGVRSLDDIKPSKNGVNTSNAFPVLAYALSDTAPLEFSLQGAGTAVRLISNAVLDSQNPHDESQRFGYALQLEFVDRHGAVIDSQYYAHQTRMVWVASDSASDALRSVTVLEDNNLPVAGARSIRLPLVGREDARSFRVRLVSSDNTIHSVLARFYQHEAVLQHQLDRLWHRLQLHARKRLAQASVHSQSRSLLTKAEKRNLMRNRWRPNGPLDNKVKPERLFVWRDTGQTQTVVAPAKVPATLPPLDRVLISDGRSMQWQLLSPSGTPAGDATIHYDWIGDERWQTANDAVVTDADGRAIVQLPPGTITVRGTSGNNLRVFINEGGKQIEQIKQVQRVRSYRLDGQEVPLRYAISHIPGQKTPLRLDFRQPIDPETTTDVTTVTVTLRDKDGQALPFPYADSHSSGHSSAETSSDGVTVSIRVPEVVSRLDRRVLLESVGAVSERIQRFWALPAEVAWVDIAAEGEALVSAYTRPEDLPHRVHVAASGSELALKEAPSDQHQSVWFALFPNDSEALHADGTMQWLHLQARAPTVNNALTDSAWRFEQLKPINTPTARELVTERTPGQPWRESARPSAFRPLVVNDLNSMALKSLPNNHRVSASLLYRQSPERSLREPFRLTLQRDGEIWFDQWLFGDSGLVRLPPVAPGVYQLLAQAPAGVQLHMNMAGVSDTVADRSRRLVYRLGPRPLEFDLTKQSKEAQTIAVRWFSDAPTDQPVRVRVQINAVSRPAIADGWTLLEREYILQSAVQGDGFLLGKKRRPVGSGQVFYIGIGTDISPGDYRITLRVAPELTGYVALSRLSPGDAPARTYLVEKDVND